MSRVGIQAHLLWFPDPTGTATIWVTEPGRIGERGTGRGNGFVWLRCGELTFFSVYLTPNETLPDFCKKLDELDDQMRSTQGNIIIAGDFNVRAIEWGSDRTNTRGRLIFETVARTGLLVLNVGALTTLCRPGCAETIPDVSLAWKNLVPRIIKWKVLEYYSGSDHQYIYFEVSRHPLR